MLAWRFSWQTEPWTRFTSCTQLDSPKSLFKNLQSRPFSKPVSTLLHFALSIQKSEGPGVIVITVDSREGYIFREGRLSSCFVKWETSNRSPVLDLDHCEPERTTAEFRRTITFAELSCYTYHLSFSSQKHLLFTTTLEQIAMPLLPGKLSSLFSPLPVSPVCWCIRMYS